MDQHGKAENVRVLRKEYAQATQSGKGRIFEQMAPARGSSRQHAIATLNASTSATNPVAS